MAVVASSGNGANAAMLTVLVSDYDDCGRDDVDGDDNENNG